MKSISKRTYLLLLPLGLVFAVMAMMAQNGNPAYKAKRINRAVELLADPDAGPDGKYVSAREHGMHALRHFYASVLLDAGESIKAGLGGDLDLAHQRQAEGHLCPGGAPGRRPPNPGRRCRRLTVSSKTPQPRESARCGSKSRRWMAFTCS